MPIQIQENILLSDYTTLKTGGVARYFGTVTNQADLAEVVAFARKEGLPLLFLGGGSNLLIDDTGFDGVVVFCAIMGREYTEREDGQVTLVCGAGEVLDEVVAESVERGYWGLENLSSIPGTVGATPVQNVGAYGVEVSHLITNVEVCNVVTGEIDVLDTEECEFGYRESFFKKENGKNYFIVSVHFVLQKNPTPKIGYADLRDKFAGTMPSVVEVRAAVIAIRRAKFPDWTVLGTAGSFFKNPVVRRFEADALREKYPELPQYEAGEGMVKISLGYVLDKVCGLRGYKVGNVGLYEAQALVLVNYGGATSTEIKKFATHISDLVYNKTKIIISPEVRFIKNKTK
jgi:UDP-N-acetylmuramate dehydrogenase